MRTGEGRLHLFVAVDRTSKFAFAQLHTQADRPTACALLQALIAACPYHLHAVLTDNGIRVAEPPKNRDAKRLKTLRGPTPDEAICRAYQITQIASDSVQSTSPRD